MTARTTGPITSRPLPRGAARRRPGRPVRLGGQLGRLGQLPTDGPQGGDRLVPLGRADGVLAELGPLEQPGEPLHRRRPEGSGRRGPGNPEGVPR
ncbi:MAG TPA: hypothetical protein VF468_14280 [Actinomycetota bacterium]|nr:hypothetical protein [Actinomycetota bacterium]